MPPAANHSNDAAGRSSSDNAAPSNAASDNASGEAPPVPDDLDRSVLGTAHEPQRLHPLTLLQRLLASVPAFVLLLFPILRNPSSENLFSLVLTFIFGVFALPAVVLQYWRFSYRITPKQIVIQQGVFNRQNRSIPIERVQNIQIQQNLVARVFGIAKVQIQTAGSSSTEGSLEYLGLDQARRIRQIIRSFQRQRLQDDATDSGSDSAADASRDAAEPARTDGRVDTARSDRAARASDRHDEAWDDAAWDERAEELFAMPLPRVLLSGAFRFSFLYIAVVFSVLQFVEPDTILRWVLSSDQFDQVTASFTQHPAVAALLTIALAVLLGWVTGILLHVNRNYGFHLWLDGDKLRTRHGLLTVTEGTVPLDKVQTLMLRTNPLMRAFGWYSLEVQTIGQNVDEQGHRVIAPFASRAVVADLAARVRAFDMPDAFGSVSRLTIRRRFVRYTVALSVVVAPAGYFWPADWWAPLDVALPWWGGALVPLLLGWAVLQYRHHGYALADDALYIRRGVLSHYVWMIPTEKFHVFYATASVFQRRLHLKTLFVDTAGAGAFAYPEVVDLPAAEADAQLSRLHDRFRTLYRTRIKAATGSATTRLSADERPQLPVEAGLPADASAAS